MEAQNGATMWGLELNMAPVWAGVYFYLYQVLDNLHNMSLHTHTLKCPYYTAKLIFLSLKSNDRR